MIAEIENLESIPEIPKLLRKEDLEDKNQLTPKITKKISFSKEEPIKKQATE